jgi:hypothetical protein
MAAGRLLAMFLQASPCGEFLDCGTTASSSTPMTAAAAGVGEVGAQQQPSFLGQATSPAQDSAVEMLLKAFMGKVKEAVATKLNDTGVAGLNC